MSVAVKRGISAKNESRKCAARFWTLFPHLLLCLSLVAYAALGALIFQYIEGGSPSDTETDYKKFLGKLVSTVQNLTSKCSTSICCSAMYCYLIAFLCDILACLSCHYVSFSEP